MSTQDVSCPNCQKSMKVPAEALGKRIRCKACSHVFTASAPEPPAQAKALPDDFKKPARAKPVVAKPKAEEPAPANAPLKFAPDDDEEDQNPYVIEKDDTDVPKCPGCAVDLDPPDTRICLNCGYDMMDRKRHRTKKVYMTTGGDIFKYWLPAIIWIILLLWLLSLLFTCYFMLGNFMRDNEILMKDDSNVMTGEKEMWIPPMFCNVCCSIQVFLLCCWGVPVIYKRIKNPKPPEVEKKK